jgi:hypothetical protein
VVENRAGAGGLIGAEAAARSAPDGHTLLIATISVSAIAPHLAPRLAWDPVRELANVAGSCVVLNAILARPDLPVRDVAELIALARTRPGALTYGSPGNGTSGHLCAEYLKSRAGIELTHAPYRGTAPLLGDLLGGRLDLAVDNLPFYVPHVREGRLRLLAVTSPERWFSVPDAPTVAEGALPGFGHADLVGPASAGGHVAAGGGAAGGGHARRLRRARHPRPPARDRRRCRAAGHGRVRPPRRRRARQVGRRGPRRRHPVGLTAPRFGKAGGRRP